MDDYSVRFWKNLETIANEKGISWSELARRIGIARVSLTHAKSNHNLPRVDRLLSIAKALEVPLEDLIKV